MTFTKTITIVGATGNQGSAVVNAFLALPDWKVRGTTRSTISSKAQTLASRGVEVVEADLSNPSSLASAFKGSTAIFLNTDFWAPFNSSLSSGKTPEEASKDAYHQEVQWGKNAVDAASKIPGLERFVYSALGSISKASGGKYKNALHWDSKSAIVEYIEQEHPELSKETSIIYVSAYRGNALLRPHYDEESGGYKAMLPCKKETICPVIDPAAKAMGGFVKALVVEEELGVRLFAYEDQISFGDAMEIWKEVTGKDCVVEDGLELEECSKRSGVPLEILEVPAFMEEFGFMAGVRGYMEPRDLNTRVEIVTYEEYLCDVDVDILLEKVDR